jgi:IclR family KDG regulon transcriptional repressor
MPTTVDDRAAIDKALCILEELNSVETPLGLTEVARRTRMSKSTAHRVLASLERHGAVERVDRRYRLGATFHRWASTGIRRRARMVEDLTPFLVELHARTRSTAHLGVLEDGDISYLSKIRSHASVDLASRVGMRAPSYCTALGKALLAYDDEAARTVAQGPFTAWTPRTIVDGDALLVALAEVRRHGFAVTIDEGFEGLTCIAAPVLDPHGRPVTAMSVSGASGQVDIPQVSVQVRAVAAAAGRALAAGRRASRVSRADLAVRPQAPQDAAVPA